MLLLFLVTVDIHTVSMDSVVCCISCYSDSVYLHIHVGVLIDV